MIDCKNKVNLKNSSVRCLVVNSGNANAFTGYRGKVSVETITSMAAEVLNIPRSRVFSSSTGVIGEELPHNLIIDALGKIVDDKTKQDIFEAAQSFITTDTYAKGSVRKLLTDQGEITIAGIAKGSGMIAPNMATMLVYLFTDASVKKDALQSYLSEINERTFNSISVDGDTSTSDTVLMAATGKSGIRIEKNDKNFSQGLASLMTCLLYTSDAADE